MPARSVTLTLTGATTASGNGTITGNPHIGICSMSFTPSSC